MVQLFLISFSLFRTLFVSSSYYVLLKIHCPISYFLFPFLLKEAGKAASLAEVRKLKKYKHLIKDYHVIPVGIETLGSYGPYALNFIKDIGRRIMEISGEKRSTSYLMQVIGMAIQRGNSACILETVSDSRKMDEVYYL